MLIPLPAWAVVHTRTVYQGEDGAMIGAVVYEARHSRPGRRWVFHTFSSQHFLKVCSSSKDKAIIWGEYRARKLGLTRIEPWKDEPHEGQEGNS